MAKVKHDFVNPQDDGADTTITRPSDWNAEHVDENGDPLDLIAAAIMATAGDTIFYPGNSVALGGSARTNNGETLSTLTATSMPSHVAGETLVAIVGWKNTPARTATTPSGWSLLGALNDGAGLNFSVYSKVATSNAETFSITLSGTAGWSELHIWKLPGGLTVTTAVTTNDTSSNTTADIPALTFAPLGTGQILTVAMTSRGDRGLTAITGTDSSLGGNNQSWGPYFAMMSMWDAATGSASSTTAAITNGSDTSISMRIGFSFPRVSALATGLYGRALLGAVDRVAVLKLLDDPIQDNFGAPDTAFEFDTSSLTGLTALSPTPDGEDANTSVKGHYYIKDNDSESVGRYASVSPPFTAIAKLSDATLRANYSHAGLFCGVATPGKMVSVLARFGDGQFIITFTQTGPTDTGPGSPSVTDPPATPLAFPLYLGIKCVSSTDVSYYMSHNGRVWHAILLNHNNSMTVASVGLVLFVLGGGTGQTSAAFDFLRIWNSAKTFVL